MSVLVLTVIGIVLDRLVVQPLRREDPIVAMRVTFGLLMVLGDVVRTIWGKDFLTRRRRPRCPASCH